MGKVEFSPFLNRISAVIKEMHNWIQQKKGDIIQICVKGITVVFQMENGLVFVAVIQ